MTNDELAFLSLADASALLRKKKLSPVELLDVMLARIDALHPRLNAYITVAVESARKEAQLAEREILRGRWRGLLHGIPVSLKDNIATKGMRTTAGSKILAENFPNEDATVVKRLRRAGAVILGKTNLHEFAYGVTTENPHFGPTRNPWDLERIPGGSTGGSAAALASGLCYASVGSDTGGSIRIPAALCGIVGLKPTFGRVSCAGVVPLSPTFDHTGPLARTVRDVTAVLGVIAGRDRNELTTRRVPPLYLQRALAKPAKHLRLGVSEFFSSPKRLGNDVFAAFAAALKYFQERGAEIREVQFPSLDAAVEPSNHIALAEATHFHQSANFFPQHAAEYGEDVRKRLELGREVRACDYMLALEMCRQVRAEFQKALEQVDAIVAPSVPIPAPRIGEKVVTTGGKEEPVRAALLRLNRPANMSGLPAISVPCGFSGRGLPIGLQLIGQPFGEAELLRIALAYEEAHDWHERHPAL